MATGYRYLTRPQFSEKDENLVILAFSGGGTRAAAFSYGALEFLRDTVIVAPDGKKSRLIDHVGVITGVSGGSFTALAYGLYGDRLFDEYEQRFLKRDVQGAIVSRVLNPGYWPSLWSTGWGRSELAADLYDEILFNGATFGDLKRGNGPMIIASATDITTGARLPFTQTTFDVLCADLDSIRISRAAAASSAVPVVLSPITLNNYGGTCDYVPPSWIQPFIDATDPPRPAARAIRHMREEAEFADGANRPYIHLVDGGVADNVGMRSVLDVLELMEALQSVGYTTPLDHIRNIIVFVVNSLSIPKVTWDKSESAPGTLQIMVKAAGVPIDHYSYESTELLRDMQAKWRAMRLVRKSSAFAAEKDKAVTAALHTPEATIYAIDVSFAQLKDNDERAYLNELPTSFHLEPEQVDRLRAAAGKIILQSPDFRRLIEDLGGRIELTSPAPAVNHDATQ
ncbi:MAG TPA: patatin-like phospholipase family protein [Bordetella sp.]|jgi:NTE family protein|nr:patatin-like phospholipase family protein [Bordetella sp.]